MLSRKLVEHLREYVLPGFELKSENLIGVLITGSRVTGGARAGSDLDAWVCVDVSDTDLSLKYHGSMCVGGGVVPLEITIQSLAHVQCRIRSEVTASEIPWLFAISGAEIILDLDGKLLQLKRLAESKLAQLGTETLEAYSGRNAQGVLPLIQIASTEVRDCVLSLARTKPTAALARALEFLPDLNLYTAIFDRVTHEDLRASPLPMSCILSGSDRPARLLDVSKYPAEKWFEDLVAEIDHHIVNSKSLRAQSWWEQFFALVDRYFAGHTGCPLYLNSFADAESWFRA